MTRVVGLQALGEGAQVGGGGECRHRGHVGVGGVGGGEVRGPQCRVTALRMTPHDGLIGQVEFGHLVGGADGVEHGAALTLADHVRRRPGGAHADVVGRDHHPAVVDHLVQGGCRAGRERLVLVRRRAAFRVAGGAVRPGDHRSRSGGRILRCDDQTGRERGDAVVAGGGVQDPPAAGVVGNLLAERFGLQKCAGCGVRVQRHRRR